MSKLMLSKCFKTYLIEFVELTKFKIFLANYVKVC